MLGDDRAQHRVTPDHPAAAEGPVAVAALGEEAVGGDPVGPLAAERRAADAHIDEPGPDRAGQVVHRPQPRDLHHARVEREALLEHRPRAPPVDLDRHQVVEERQRVEHVPPIERAFRQIRAKAAGVGDADVRPRPRPHGVGAHRAERRLA